MIFLDKYAIRPRFPKNWSYPVTNLQLTLHNRYTNKQYIFNDILLEENEIYYILKDLDLKELPTGEYEYTIKDKSNIININKVKPIVVSKGLLQIGPRETTNIQYNKKTEYIEFKYESE